MAELIPRLKEMRERYNALLMANIELKGLVACNAGVRQSSPHDSPPFLQLLCRRQSRCLKTRHRNTRLPMKTETRPSEARRCPSSWAPLQTRALSP